MKMRWNRETRQYIDDIVTDMMNEHLTSISTGREIYDLVNEAITAVRYRISSEDIREFDSNILEWSAIQQWTHEIVNDLLDTQDSDDIEILELLIEELEEYKVNNINLLSPTLLQVWDCEL